MEISPAIAGSSFMLLIVLCKNTESANEISTVRRQRKYSGQIARFTDPELPKQKEMPFGPKFKRAI
jgi:cell division septation protein DedD